MLSIFLYKIGYRAKGKDAARRLFGMFIKKFGRCPDPAAFLKESGAKNFCAKLRFAEEFDNCQL